jgi:hypothetical protein
MARVGASGLAAVAALSAAALVTGCGLDGPDQRVDPAVKPPPGWRTVVNRSGRFTFAAPSAWLVQRTGRQISVRPPTLAATVALRADRSPRGQRTPAAEYAFETLRNLPGFKGRLVPGPARIRGTPYGSARVSAVGRVRGARGRQRVSSVALRVPDQVTYSVLVYGAADAAVADTIIRTLRTGVG